MSSGFSNAIAGLMRGSHPVGSTSYVANGGFAETRGELNGTVRQYGTQLSVGDLNRFDQAMAGMSYKHVGSDERRALLAVARELSKDGVLSEQDLDTLINMINDFSAKGNQAKDGSWANRHLYQPNMHGSPVTNAVNAELAQKFDNKASNTAFLNTVNSLLTSTSPNHMSELIRDALNGADLNQLSGPERVKIIAMLTDACKDGCFDNAEGYAIHTALRDALGNADAWPRPVPTPTPPTWSTRTYHDGIATVDLGNYTLRLDEHNSAMVLVNKENGETTRIWGNSQLDVSGNGYADMNFKGPLTFQLGDGTKITVDTKPVSQCGCGPAIEQPHKVTITRGEDSLVVTGLDASTRGDLTVSQGKLGRTLDKWTPDGVKLYENPFNPGWMVQDGFGLRPVVAPDVGGHQIHHLFGQAQPYIPSELVMNNLSAMRFSVASYELGAMLNNMFGR